MSNITTVTSIKKALKFASKDKSREILMGVHLDVNGDVVATDCYRLYVEHGGCVGDSLDVPAELAQKVAKLKGVKAVEFFDDGNEVVAKYDGGSLRARACYGKYPNYMQLMKCEPVAVAHPIPKQVIPLLKEYKRAKANAVLSVKDRDLRVIGGGADLPIGRFEKACDGEDVEAAYNPSFLQSVLEACGKECELRIESKVKPLFAVSGDVEIALMPVRSECKLPKDAAKRVEEMADKKAGAKVNSTVAEPKKPKTPKRKPEPPTKVKVTRAAIIPTAEGIRAEVIDEHIETVEHVAEAVTLASVRKRFAKAENVAVTQKREGTPIWVSGETRPLHDELMELGFKWSRKKSAWYLRQD